VITKHVELVYEGGMAFAAAMSSGHTFRFDDRPSNTGASPVETVLAALAACSAMDVVSIALKKRQRISRYVVHVTATQREAYPQVFPRIDVVHEVEGAGLSEAAIRRCIELSALKYCPVSDALRRRDGDPPSLRGSPHRPIRHGCLRRGRRHGTIPAARRRRLRRSARSRPEMSGTVLVR